MNDICTNITQYLVSHNDPRHLLANTMTENNHAQAQAANTYSSPSLQATVMPTDEQELSGGCRLLGLSSDRKSPALQLTRTLTTAKLPQPLPRRKVSTFGRAESFWQSYRAELRAVSSRLMNEQRSKIKSRKSCLKPWIQVAVSGNWLRSLDENSWVMKQAPPLLWSCSMPSPTRTHRSDTMLRRCTGERWSMSCPSVRLELTAMFSPIPSVMPLSLALSPGPRPCRSTCPMKFSRIICLEQSWASELRPLSMKTGSTRYSALILLIKLSTICLLASRPVGWFSADLLNLLGERSLKSGRRGYMSPTQSGTLTSASPNWSFTYRMYSPNWSTGMLRVNCSPARRITSGLCLLLSKQQERICRSGVTRMTSLLTPSVALPLRNTDWPKPTRYEICLSPDSSFQMSQWCCPAVKSKEAAGPNTAGPLLELKAWETLTVVGPRRNAQNSLKGTSKVLWQRLRVNYLRASLG